MLDAVLWGPELLFLYNDAYIPRSGNFTRRRLAPAGTPILMLSALNAVTDRVVGLEVCAWDYLAKAL